MNRVRHRLRFPPLFLLLAAGISLGLRTLAASPLVDASLRAVDPAYTIRFALGPFGDTVTLSCTFAAGVRGQFEVSRDLVTWEGRGAVFTHDGIFPQVWTEPLGEDEVLFARFVLVSEDDAS